MGDEIYLMTAQTIVARTFGYDDMTELDEFIGLADLSVPDRYVDSSERMRRFEQYVYELTQNDFSNDEAVDIISRVGTRSWWGFETEPGEEVEVREIPVPRPRCSEVFSQSAQKRS